MSLLYHRFPNRFGTQTGAQGDGLRKRDSLQIGVPSLAITTFLSCVEPDTGENLCTLDNMVMRLKCRISIKHVRDVASYHGATG